MVYSRATKAVPSYIRHQISDLQKELESFIAEIRTGLVQGKNLEAQHKEQMQHLDIVLQDILEVTTSLNQATQGITRTLKSLETSIALYHQLGEIYLNRAFEKEQKSGTPEEVPNLGEVPCEKNSVSNFPMRSVEEPSTLTIFQRAIQFVKGVIGRKY